MNKLIYLPEKIVLMIAIIFVSISTTIAGISMMVQPGNSLGTLSLTFFHDPNFHDYFVPGFMLSVMVGAANLLALILIIENHPQQFSMAMLAAALLLLWIVSHMYMTQVFHWLQILYMSLSLIILLISSSLSKQTAVMHHHKHRI